MAAVLVASTLSHTVASAGPRRCGAVRASDKVLLARPPVASLQAHRSRGARRPVAPAAVAGGPLFETAVLLPALVPTLVRAALAGVFIYSTLQWNSARTSRKEVERIVDDAEVSEKDRQARLRRLQGKKDDESTPE